MVLQLIFKQYKLFVLILPSLIRWAFDNLPQAVSILDEDTPAVGEPILIDVKSIAAHDSNKVRGQFDNGADVTVTKLLV